MMYYLFFVWGCLIWTDFEVFIYRVKGVFDFHESLCLSLSVFLRTLLTHQSEYDMWIQFAGCGDGQTIRPLVFSRLYNWHNFVTNSLWSVRVMASCQAHVHTLTHTHTTETKSRGVKRCVNLKPISHNITWSQTPVCVSNHSVLHYIEWNTARDLTAINHMTFLWKLFQYIPS
jgi:hypothetical protein